MRTLLYYIYTGLIAHRFKYFGEKYFVLNWGTYFVQSTFQPCYIGHAPELIRAAI